MEEQWIQWSSKLRNRDVTVQILSPRFTYRGNSSVYFAVSAYGNTYPFSIGLDSDDNIEPILTASWCSTDDQCEWNKQMGWYMEEIEDLDIGLILDKAVSLALTVGRGRRKNATKLPRQVRMSEVDDLFSYVLSKPHGFKIVPSSMSEWQITSSKNVLLNLTINKSGNTGVYGDAVVVYPRLAIGMNVDIGGVITHEGLVPSKPVSHYTDIVDILADVLADEVPHIVDTPYTEQEVAICKGKRQRQRGLVSLVTLEYDSDVEDDHVGVPEAMYFAELDKNPQAIYIMAEITSALGLSGWYVAQPMDYPEGKVGMSKVALVNLNVYDDIQGRISFGGLSIPTTITVRPRATRVPAEPLDEGHLVDVFSSYTVVTLAHTYAVKDNLNMYVDIVDIQPPAKACLLRDEGKADVLFFIDYSLYPVRKYLSPLAIPSYGYDSEESSEED